MHQKTFISFGRTTLPHPPYSLDLVSSNNHLFGSIKKGLGGKHCASNDEIKIAGMKWLKEQSIEFYETGIYGLIRRLNIAIDRVFFWGDGMSTLVGYLMPNQFLCIKHLYFKQFILK